MKTYLVAALLLALCAIWLILNQLRVHYYNDSVEGIGDAPTIFWTVVRVQDLLHWPIGLLFACLCAIGVYELACYLASKLSP